MDKFAWKKVETMPTACKPQQRWGHSCCVVGQEIVYFGGYADSQYMNDLWAFDTETMLWRQVKTSGDLPACRSNCSMNYDPQHKNIVIFGGGGNQRRRFNDICVLDWETQVWTQIEPNKHEAAPWQRTYHTGDLIYPYLVVFGGEAVTDMDDTWIFNFETLSWAEVKIPKEVTKPVARRFHSSTVIGKQLFIIAGCYSKYRCLNDIFSMDLTSLFETGKTDELCWKERALKGGSILTRWGHTSQAYEEKIYIFAGRFSNDLNDIAVYDPSTDQVKTLRTSKDAPTPRRRHSAAFIGCCHIIFGGFNGEYFNDLHYINLQDARPLRKTHLSTKKMDSMVNHSKHHDTMIHSKQGNEFYLHQGLFAHSFNCLEDMTNFLANIDCRYTQKELESIFTVLYRGYGDSFKTDIHTDYDIKLFSDKQAKIEDQKLNVNPITESSFPKKNQDSRIQILRNKEFDEYIQQRVLGSYSDSLLLFNKNYEIPVNKMSLAVACPFFWNYLSVSKNTDKIEIVLDANWNIFTVFINYLSIGLLVIPEIFTVESWVELFRIAEYFCDDRLKEITEEQISQLINNKNLTDLIHLSQEYGLGMLKVRCAEFSARSIIQEDPCIDLEKKIEEKHNEKEKMILREHYQTCRFDFLQRKFLEEKALTYLTSKRKGSEKQPQRQKENYEPNYADY